MDKAVALAVKITADGKAAAAGIDAVTGKTSKMAKVGKIAGRVLAAGLGLAVVAGAGAAQAAAEDQAAQVKLASAIQNATGARAADVAKTEDWIAAQGKALGVADDQLRPALENLVTATKDVGKAQELAQIAMDISARKGISLETVSKKLAKAQATGNVAALAQYGIKVKDTEGKQISLEKATKRLADTYKGAAAAQAETAAGKQQRLKVAMGELQEEIGAKLLPVLLKASEYGLKVVDWIDKNQAAAAAIIGTLGGLLAIVKLVSIAETIWAKATKVAAAAQAVFNAVMAANPVVLVVVAVVALAAALVLAYKKSETFRNIVNKVFGAISATVGKVVGFIKDHWQTMLAVLAGPLGIAVVQVVKHWDTIRDKATAAWDRIKGGFIAVKDKIAEVAGAIKDAAVAGFNAILDPVRNVIAKVQELYDKLLKLKAAATGSGVRGPNLSIPGTGSSGGGGHEPAGSQRRGGDVHIHLDGRTFVGSERALAAELKRLLGNDLRRYGGQPA